MSEISVLVNGNRCKTYIHEGRTYIEGKPGSEYEIEIKNNTSGRVEAVASVDGLSVMSGKPAVDNEGGYVIGPWTSYRIKGFRYSDENVGAFRFNKKNYSYAAHKHDGSEINCGVIACKIYTEKVYRPPVYTKRLVPRTVWDEEWYYDNTYWGSTTAGNSGSSLGGLYGPGRFGYSTSTVGDTIGNMKSSNADTGDLLRKFTKCAGISGQSVTNTNVTLNYCATDAMTSAQNATSAPEVFTLGTEWGTNKVSKVVSTTFNRDYMSYSFEIYYTERDGLVSLGVPLAVPAQVNFPESFPGNYAKPPSGWRP